MYAIEEIHVPLINKKVIIIIIIIMLLKTTILIFVCGKTS